MIAGYGLNDVEHVSTQNNNNFCDPMDLDYTVYSHSSVATDLGILTCGGYPPAESGHTSKCTILTKEGQTTSFPSMRKTREDFGLGIVNDLIFAVGDVRGDTTMEKIDYKTDSEWTLTDSLPFSVYDHCLTTTTSSIVITGGYDQNVNVSKIILSFVNENKKK